MTEWVALLRGVNVGGITIRSADLREMLAAMGLEDVRTFLASGNAAFRSPRERGDLKLAIEAALGERFGYDAWIVLVTRDEIEAAIASFPFDADDADRQPWVIFCVDAATRDGLVEAALPLDAAVDPVAAGPGVVYWNPAKGTSTDTAFAKIVARTTYKSRTTNRNLRTLQKIVA
ncbi:MAG: DUF1697 domain-containing protein [Microbacterium sp.]|uniref:DUF1697 domain-containing protein n=1 Tax=Microbacterium sp. TaxID=51671 RepID=UPI00271653AD|nr:DUF1697 domain-containing protein [Microbacterium sp.]MDO8382749.1 DUF1697 domain-containing protein [Microbacterium sp.]